MRQEEHIILRYIDSSITYQKFKVHKLYNTTRYMVGDWLSKAEVDHLIDQGIKVTIQ